ncbi:beta-ketoacyl-[acyl-carrier-protein] synthase family protein [Saccharothrix longispora]|uniref:3-oxoacyl-[acyl-carrier-protein] synthase II n=1 Tax=Saccharothrix longispora TaxID=33920 RepID=A0ABU1PUN4_9PSEU|nr:beta-ketoacyl-[acyl-carrier-protein] synthase family protein [Saccharothrix longispora]MDR6594348.1 3-oxoacyl-[acyl-carrier-protein] synthase II [Saccharothrix longispora]
MSESVAVTGIGLVSPVGTAVDEVFEAVCAGRSGIVRPPEGHALHGVVDVAAIGPPVDPESVIPPKEARVVDRSIVLGVRAAEDALADAGIEVGQDVDPYRVAVVLSGVGGLGTLARQAVERSRRGRLGVSPFMLPGVLPNMAAARVAIKFGIRGYMSSSGTACAAGGQSIGEAVRILRSGEADVVVCGCTEAPLFPTFADAFGNALALARGWSDPTTASRPFDRRRNGFVLGEGAGVLVLERAGFARARGAAVLAHVLGWGATSDGYHPTTPRPDGSGAAESMRIALRDSGLSTNDIGYLNAHGTGTKAGDSAESKAIRGVYGDGMPPVSSTKGITGHLLGASGVVEAAIAVTALRKGLLPPTHNLDDPDPACDLNHVRGEPSAAAVDAVMSNSFGFGGHNVSVVFGRADG